MHEQAGGVAVPGRSEVIFEDFLRVRMAAEHGESEGVVAGNDTLDIISDLVSFVLFGFDGYNGMLAGYDKIEFLSPVYIGDILHAVGKIVKAGNRSRTIECEVYRIAEGTPKPGLGSLELPVAHRFFDQPQLVARARAVMVISREVLAAKTIPALGRANGTGPGRSGSGLEPSKTDAVFEDFLRVRMASEHGESEGVVAGNDTLDIVSDLVSFVLFGFDGYNGMLAGYDKIEFLSPVYIGDILHAVGKLVRVGNRSRTVECEVYRIAEGTPKPGLGSLKLPVAHRFFDQPQLVAGARAVMVISREVLESKSVRA